MYLQNLVIVLILGSNALAAQLTQVSNYGGSARAKPGMYVVFLILSLQKSMLIAVAGGFMCQTQSKVTH